MRMRQSLAQFEEAFHEETVEDRQRRERLREQAMRRTVVRRQERTSRHGTLRFIGLVLAIIATTVIVTWAMFQALAIWFA